MSTQEKAAWEQAEEQDEALLTADDLVTEVICIQGKPTLTHVGYASIVNRKGGITVESLEFKETDEGIFVWGFGENETGERRYACHMEPRSPRKNEQSFDWAKAFSKFQRNLFKMFVYGDQLVDETIATWKSKNFPAPVNAPKMSVLESAKQAARETYNSEAITAVAGELGIEKLDLFVRYQHVHGDHHDWDVVRWKAYRSALLEFTERKGLLYSSLTPPEETEAPASDDQDAETLQEVANL